MSHIKYNFRSKNSASYSQSPSAPRKNVPHCCSDDNNASKQKKLKILKFFKRRYQKILTQQNGGVLKKVLNFASKFYSWHTKITLFYSKAGGFDTKKYI